MRAFLHTLLHAMRARAAATHAHVRAALMELWRHRLLDENRRRDHDARSAAQCRLQRSAAIQCAWVRTRACVRVSSTCLRVRVHACTRAGCALPRATRIVRAVWEGPRVRGGRVSDLADVGRRERERALGRRFSGQPQVHEKVRAHLRSRARACLRVRACARAWLRARTLFSPSMLSNAPRKKTQVVCLHRRPAKQTNNETSMRGCQWAVAALRPELSAKGAARVSACVRARRRVHVRERFAIREFRSCCCVCACVANSCVHACACMYVRVCACVCPVLCALACVMRMLCVRLRAYAVIARVRLLLCGERQVHSIDQRRHHHVLQPSPVEHKPVENPL